jgi:hypothetical protein
VQSVMQATVTASCYQLLLTSVGKSSPLDRRYPRILTPLSPIPNENPLVLACRSDAEEGFRLKSRNRKEGRKVGVWGRETGASGSRPRMDGPALIYGRLDLPLRQIRFLVLPLPLHREALLKRQRLFCR